MVHRLCSQIVRSQLPRAGNWLGWFMPENLEQLKAALLAEAMQLEPDARTRSPLAPHRETVVVLRAKRLSYEKISKFFSARRCRVSPAAVGRFCRQHASAADVSRFLVGQQLPPLTNGGAQPSHPPVLVPSFITRPRGPKTPQNN